MASPSLPLGPPEINDPAYAPKPPSDATTADTSGEPAAADGNNQSSEGVTSAAAAAPKHESEDSSSDDSGPIIGRTENGAFTFLSTGNPCLDFFFHVVPKDETSSYYGYGYGYRRNYSDGEDEFKQLTDRLEAAWGFDPLTALKLLCNLRGIRGTGKSNKEGFYAAALWLFKNHPKTLSCNIGSIARFGCFKDLPEILFRLLEGSDVRRIQKEEWGKRNPYGRLRGTRTRRGSGKFQSRKLRRRLKKQQSCRASGEADQKKAKKERKQRLKQRASVPRTVRMENDVVNGKKLKEKASNLRMEKKVAMAKKVIDRCQNDESFNFLYNKVAEHFANCLKSDLENLNSGEVTKISLAAKWCPSINSSFDRSTLLCESIAKILFPQSEYEGIDEAHYAYRVRDRLRKEVLVPLRKALEVPEVYIGEQDWGSIPYTRVPSLAMKLHKRKFMRHDRNRFKKYLEDVESGKAKIAAGALLPHDIIASLEDKEEDNGKVAELQWNRMVQDMAKEGKLDNCISVCDMSGSMYGTSMHVCAAMGLLVSDLSREPWKGKIITFSKYPQLHLIWGDDLKSKIKFMKAVNCGYNTDFQKVFDLILTVAKSGKLKPDQMVKRVFVFSDMEFDRASEKWETDYESIERKFTEAGYGAVVPQMVFWRLRDSGATPVTKTQKGAALVSGFSKNLLKPFLDNDGPIDPVLIMEEAISGPEYQKLIVVD